MSTSFNPISHLSPQDSNGHDVGFPAEGHPAGETAARVVEGTGTAPPASPPPAELSLVERVEAMRHQLDALAAEQPTLPAAAFSALASEAEPTIPQLASARDATARLVVDASAAAEALGNLKRMLEQQVPIGEPKPLPEPMVQRDAAVVELVAPPPPPVSLRVQEPVRPPAETRSREMLPIPLPMPAPPGYVERARFDVRGFMAGFALSWAIGAVLYLYMAVG